MVIALLLGSLAGCWVYKDAMERGRTLTDAIIWGILTLLFLILALPAWLITRPPLKNNPTINNTRQKISGRVCPKCNLLNPVENKYCSDCGNKLVD